MASENLRTILELSKSSYDEVIKTIENLFSRAKELILVIGALISLNIFSVTILTNAGLLLSLFFFSIAITICLIVIVPSKIKLISFKVDLSKDAKFKEEEVLCETIKEIESITDYNSEVLKECNRQFRWAIIMIGLGLTVLIGSLVIKLFCGG